MKFAPVFAGGSITMDALAMLAYGFSGAAFATRMAEPRRFSSFSVVCDGLVMVHVPCV